MGCKHYGGLQPMILLAWDVRIILLWGCDNLVAKNIIFTSLATIQMKACGLNRGIVVDAYRYPTKEGELHRNRHQRSRTLENKEIGVVYRQNDFGDTVIEDVWLRPVEKK